MARNVQQPARKHTLIRKAAADDAEAVQRLYYDYLGTHKEYNPRGMLKSIERDSIYVAVADESKIIGTLTSAKTFDCIDRGTEPEKGIIFIGGVNSIVVGDKHIFFDNGVTHEIRNLCVDSAYRHQGIAKLLIEQALSETPTLSYALVWAPSGKVRAKELWESQGFRSQEILEDIGNAVPWFCEQCAERKNGCSYCECHVYVEDKNLK